MSYDSGKDVLIKLFEMKQGEGSLLFSLMSYSSNEPKLQITRTFDKKDGSTGYSKAGRLSKDEIKFFLEHGKEMLEMINKTHEVV